MKIKKLNFLPKKIGAKILFLKTEPINLNIIDDDVYDKDEPILITDILNVKNKTKIQSNYRSSELFHGILLNRDLNSSKKIFVKFLLRFIISHILASSVTLLKSLVQNYVNQYCWLEKSCICNNDLLTKIYGALMDYFSYWVLLLWMYDTTCLSLAQRGQNVKFKCFFYFICSTPILLYEIVINEKEQEILICYFYLLFCLVSFSFLHLIELKWNYKNWIKLIIQLNGLILILFSNYIVCKFSLQPLNSSFIKYLGAENGINFFQLFLVAYFKIFLILVKNCALKLSLCLVRYNKGTESVIFNLRFALCFLISINVSNALKIVNSQWGSWILIISYANFIFLGYTRIDIISTLIFKCIGFICKKKKETNEKKKFQSEEDNMNKLNIEKADRFFSGSLLDLTFVSNSCIFIWLFSNRWRFYYTYPALYENCKFEISNQFFMAKVGWITVIFVNFFLTTLIIYYSIKKKKIVFEYKITKSLIKNTFGLFLVHSMFEGNIQMFFYSTSNKE